MWYNTCLLLVHRKNIILSLSLLSGYLFPFPSFSLSSQYPMIFILVERLCTTCHNFHVVLFLTIYNSFFVLPGRKANSCGLGYSILTVLKAKIMCYLVFLAYLNVFFKILHSNNKQISLDMVLERKIYYCWVLHSELIISAICIILRGRPISE